MFANFDLTDTSGGATALKFRKGQVLFAQGQAADSVFYIQQGKVKITVVSAQGKEAVVAVLGADDFCGEGCLAGQRLRMVGHSDDRVRLPDRGKPRSSGCCTTIPDSPTLHDAPAGAQVELRPISSTSFSIQAKSGWRGCFLLANFGKEGRPEPIIAKISQETLAEMIGTTRSRVSFFMNKFRRLGFIDYNGSIKVHSSLLNVVLRDDQSTSKPE